MPDLSAEDAAPCQMSAFAETKRIQDKIKSTI